MLSKIKTILFLIAFLAQSSLKLAQSTQSFHSVSRNALMFIDENNSLYFQKVGHNEKEPLLKLYTSEHTIYGVGYSPTTNIVVTCEGNAIKYAKLKNPLEPSILLHDECKAINYDWHNNTIYYYSKTTDKIKAIYNFTENKTPQHIHSIINRQNVLSLVCDPFLSLLFWVELNNTSGTRQITQLNTVTDTNEQIPETYSLEEFDTNEFGSPVTVDIDYLRKQIYAKTDNSYLLAIDYNDFYGKQVKVLDVSTVTYSESLSSIAFCNPYIYFQDYSQQTITGHDVSKPSDQYHLPNISGFNNHVKFMFCVPNFRKTLVDESNTASVNSTQTETNSNNSTKITAQFNISSQNSSDLIIISKITENFEHFYYILFGIALLMAVIIVIIKFVFKIELKISRRNGRYTYGTMGGKSERVHFIRDVSNSAIEV